jgi:spermidine synthase
VSLSRAGADLIERRDEEGRAVELYRRGEAYDLLLEGRRVSSDQRRSESALVELTMAPLSGRDDVSVLVAGLGMGFLLRAVLDTPGVRKVDVVEGSPAVIEWSERYFAAFNGDVLKDTRVTLHRAEFGAFVRQIRLGAAPAGVPAEGWMAVILDLDEGPSAPSRGGNARFYTDEGLESLEVLLRPGGVLGVWSVTRETEFVRRLHGRFQNVAEVAVPVEVGDQSSLDYVYRGRRPPPPPSGDRAPN